MRTIPAYADRLCLYKEGDLVKMQYAGSSLSRNGAVDLVGRVVKVDNTDHWPYYDLEVLEVVVGDYVVGQIAKDIAEPALKPGKDEKSNQEPQ